MRFVVSGVALLFLTTQLVACASPRAAHQVVTGLKPIATPNSEKMDLWSIRGPALEQLGAGIGSEGHVLPQNRFVGVIPEGGSRVMAGLMIYGLGPDAKPHLMQWIGFNNSIARTQILGGHIIVHFEGGAPPAVLGLSNDRLMNISGPGFSEMNPSATVPPIDPLADTQREEVASLPKINRLLGGEVFASAYVRIEDGAPNVYYVVDQSKWDALSDDTRHTLISRGGPLTREVEMAWRLHHGGNVCVPEEDFLMLHVVNEHHVEVGLDYTVFVHGRDTWCKPSSNSYSPM